MLLDILFCQVSQVWNFAFETDTTIIMMKSKHMKTDAAY